MNSLRSVAFVALFAAVGAFAPAAQCYRSRRGAQGLYMGGAAGVGSTKPGKEARVAEVVGKLESSTILFTIKGDGFTVAQIRQLRDKLPETVQANVVKNTLMKRAVTTVPQFDCVDPLLKTSNLWFFCGEEIGDTIKTLEGFLKETGKDKTHTIRGGVMDGKMLDPAAVVAVSKLPTKKELMTKIAVGIKGVPQRIAKRIKAVPTKTARAIKLAGEEVTGGSDGTAAPVEE